MGVSSNASVNRQSAIGVSVFLFSGSRLKLRTPEPSSLRRHPGNPAMEFRAASTDGPMTEAEWEQESRILREAGHGLFKHLLSMYALRKLTAKDFSIAAFWASRAKVPGADWAAYGLPPDSQTGKYQRRLDELLPGAGTLVPVKTPCIDRKEPIRSTMHLLVRPLHESLWEEVRDDRDILEKVDRKVWPPCYENHRVVRECRARGDPSPVPLSLYLDGVRFTSPLAGRSDTALGIWGINLVSSKRHLIATLRSLDFCRCGCKGWCTLWPVYFFIAACLRCLVLGKRFERDWFGQDLEIGNDLYHLLHERGVDLGFRAVVVFMKLDLGELSHLGFPTVSSKFCPCPFCKCTKSNMHSLYDGITTQNVPWPLRMPEDYAAECAARKIIVVILLQRDVDDILHVLGGDRSLRNAVPRLRLEGGDRLEPSPSLPDTAAFPALALPAQVVFWRERRLPGGASLDSVVHENPLFAEDLGTSPSETLTVDALHSLYMGPVMRTAAAAIWRVLLLNPWGHQGPKSQKLDLGVRRLRAQLLSWSEAQGIPAGERFNDLTLKMLGSENEMSENHPTCTHPGGELNVKAAESATLLLWAMNLLQEYVDDVPFGHELLGAGENLLEFLDIMRAEDDVLTVAAQKKLVGLMQGHLLLCERAWLHYTPKHHMCCHLAARTASL